FCTLHLQPSSCPTKSNPVAPSRAWSNRFLCVPSRQFICVGLCSSVARGPYPVHPSPNPVQTEVQPSPSQSNRFPGHAQGFHPANPVHPVSASWFLSFS